MPMHKILNQLRLRKSTTDDKVFLLCSGNGFRTEGTYSPDHSDETVLALIPEHQKDAISFIDVRAISLLEFRRRSEYQKMAGAHPEQASQEEIEGFRASHGEPTKLQVDRKFAERNEHSQGPKFKVNWPAAPTEAFRYNVMSFAIYLMEKDSPSGETLFRETFSKLSEVVFLSGKEGVSREDSKVLIPLSDIDFNSSIKHQNIFDRLESVL